jgi:hypothetical protein
VDDAEEALARSGCHAAIFRLASHTFGSACEGQDLPMGAGRLRRNHGVRAEVCDEGHSGLPTARVVVQLLGLATQIMMADVSWRSKQLRQPAWLMFPRVP